MKKLESIINSLLITKIAYFIEKNIERNDNCITSVTRVAINNGFKNLNVYIHIMGDEKFRFKIMKQLDNMRPDLQHSISKTTRLKFTPVIKFILDNESINKREKLLSIIEKVNK